MKTATVKEIITKLNSMNPDLPCYFRPKYSGTTDAWMAIPVKINGIAEMQGNPRGDITEDHVTFLC